jgi:hypothetical protein
VLVAGGEITNFQGSTNTTLTAELFDSESNSFSSTGALSDSRTKFYMTALDDRRILVAGGMMITGRDLLFLNRLGGAETFANSVFTRVPTSMHDHRSDLAGAHLSNGSVLLVGGVTNSSTASGTELSTAEIFQSSTNTFVSTPPMSRARRNPTATAVRNGSALTVLVAGGFDGHSTLSSAEVFDPALQRFRQPSGGATMLRARWQHTATLLNNGQVLLIGGLDGNLNAQATAEIYDPATETFRTTGSMRDPRVNHTATLLQNGRVLIVGGSSDVTFGVTLRSAEINDPSTGTFTALSTPLHTARLAHTATLLNDGRVLIVGGRLAGGVEMNTTEIFDGTSFTAGPNLAQGRAGHGAVLLP